MSFVYLIGCAIVSYLVGTINPSYIIGKRKNFDIRETGSGNAGGSNALLTMGKKVGVWCMLFDIFKAYAIVKLSMILLPNEELAGAVSSAAVTLGHIFPFYMNFKGGKGLACLGGVYLAYSWQIALIALTIELIVVLIVDYICVVPLTASLAFPVIYYARGGSVQGTLILLIVTVVMFYKHYENLVRIREGIEVHFSYLWKSDAEKERVKKAMGEEEYARLEKKLNGQ